MSKQRNKRNEFCGFKMYIKITSYTGLECKCNIFTRSSERFCIRNTYRWIWSLVLRRGFVFLLVIPMNMVARSSKRIYILIRNTNEYGRILDRKNISEQTYSCPRDCYKLSSEIKYDHRNSFHLDFEPNGHIAFNLKLIRNLLLWPYGIDPLHVYK